MDAATIVAIVVPSVIFLLTAVVATVRMVIKLTQYLVKSEETQKSIDDKLSFFINHLTSQHDELETRVIDVEHKQESLDHRVYVLEVRTSYGRGENGKRSDPK